MFCLFQEGYWECSASLGSLLGVDVDYFANVFLKNRGISSLGRLHYRLILENCLSGSL